MASEQEVLQAIVDANDHAVFAVDRDLRYLAFNKSHASVMRELYGAEIVLGGRLSDFQTVEADRAATAASFERALAGARVVATADSGEPGRERRSFDIEYVPLTDAAGAVVGVIVRVAEGTRLQVESGLRRGEERFALLFENMLEGFAYCRMLYDEEGRPDDLIYLAVNPAFGRLTGLTDVVGRRITEVIPTVKSETPEIFEIYGKVAETGEPAEFDIDFTPLNLWLHISVFQPEPDHFVAVFTDITESKRAEAVRAFLAGTGSGPQDEPFFEALARYLAETLDMFYVCIDRLEGDGLTARTVAVWCDGHFEDNVTYALKDTPCGDVVGQAVCCFPASVCQFFPRDQVLQDLQAESYIGVTLFDFSGRPIGLIAVIGRDPLANRPLAEATLALVAARAAGELQRQDAEAELRQLNERLDLAQRASGAGIWTWDVVTGAIEWSPEMFVLFGLDPVRDAAGFDAWNKAMHPDDVEAANARVSRALAEHAVIDSEYRIVRPNGDARWINALGRGVYDELGEPINMSGMCIDITERKLVEEQLRETRDYLENLFRYANAPVIVWDPQLRITRFNHAFEELTQRRAEEVAGQHLELLFPADERRGQALDLVTSASAGERWEVVEIPILRADGEVRTVLWNSATVFAADGVTPSATIAQGQDITDRSEAEDQIRRLNTDLERRVDERTRDLTAANAELEEFVYSVAHDLRSPLRALSGFSESVQADYGELIDETGRDYLRRIRNAALHLGDLMDALLSLSKIAHRDVELSEVDLSTLARDVAEHLRDADPERAVEFEIEDGLVARTDPAICEIVVENLLANAWKFSAAESPARIGLRAACIDGQRTYVVSDNGVGFDPQYAGKLFAPFERLHTVEEFPGTGIGLATVRRAVTRVDGRCWAEGELDAGARVYFSLGERC